MEEPTANLCYIHVKRGGKVLRTGAIVIENQTAINKTNRMAVNGSCCLLGDTDERFWFGILTCSTAKSTSMNVVNEKHQGLGTEGSEMPHPLFHSVSEILTKIRSWHWISTASRGPQSDGRHPFPY